MKRKARFITIVSNKPQTISPLESRLLRTEGEKIRSGIASPLLGVEDPLLGPAFAMAAYCVRLTQPLHHPQGATWVDESLHRWPLSTPLPRHRRRRPMTWG